MARAGEYWARPGWAGLSPKGVLRKAPKKGTAREFGITSPKEGTGAGAKAAAPRWPGAPGSSSRTPQALPGTPKHHWESLGTPGMLWDSPGIL